MEYATCVGRSGEASELWKNPKEDYFSNVNSCCFVSSELNVLSYLRAVALQDGLVSVMWC